MKLHVFDDNVLITGANLSNDYFTNWQDWCYVIQSAPHLANFVSDLNDVISDASYQIDGKLMLQIPSNFPIPGQKPWEYKNVLSQLLKVFWFSSRTKILKGSTLSPDEYFHGNTESKPLLDVSSKRSDAHDPSDVQTILSQYEGDTERS